ncbi:DUF452 family protein [Testudinibacter sp. P27/CKL/0425]
MQTQWIISTEQNTRLMLYFAGWGTSPELVSNWQLPPDCDALLIWDYRDVKLEVNFSQYSDVHLVAWSMGVWAAEQRVADLPLASAWAINGTPHLRDDEYGIPTAIFDGTLQGFNALTRSKFERRMCGSRELLQQYQQITPRPTDEIAQELAAVAAHLPRAKAASIAWTGAIIGEQDQIFPTANQQRYWQQRACLIKTVAAPHFALPFFSGWEAFCL